MGDVALRIEELGKRYLIGATLNQEQLVFKQLGRLMVDPFRRLASVLRGHSTYIDQNEFWALKDISFDVKHGEIVGILGRNGAGKSTLLKILAQITAPTTGRAKVYGSLGALLEVGAAFHIDLTAKENVYLHGSIYGRSRKETSRIFDDIIQFAELEQFVNTQVKKFSSGMYSRLAFAVAAHFDTDILIVDEVLATGDAKFVKKCLAKMENVAMTGRTVLFVSHSIDSVLRLCTRGILLDHGKMIGDAGVQETVDQYMSLTEVGEVEAPPPKPERVYASDDAPAFPDKSVRLHAIRALTMDGKPSLEFDVTEPFIIETEHEVVEQKHLLNVHLYFIDALGRRLFVTMDNLDTPHRSPQRAGIHRTRCIVPGNLLNQGGLEIEYTVCTNPTTANYVMDAEALQLTIKDDRLDGGVRGDWTREWMPAIVRPRLKWEHLI